MFEKGIPMKKPFPDFRDYPEHAFFCLLYEDLLERNKAIVSFFRNAIDKKAKIICLCDQGQQEKIRSILLESEVAGQEDITCSNKMFSVVNMEETGCLMFAVSAPFFESNPLPPAQTAADWLRHVESEAKADGFTGLSVLLEVNDVHFTSGNGWFAELAHELDQLTIHKKLSILSAFNLNDLPAELILEAMKLYPTLVYDGRVFRNDHYLPYKNQKSEPVMPGVFQRFLRRLDRTRNRKNSLQRKRPETYRRGQVLEAIFEAAPIGLWLLDKQHRMVFTNQNFCDATGVTADRFLKTSHYSKVMKSEEVIKCMVSDSQALNCDKPLECEEQLTSPDGSRRTFQIVKTKVMSAEDEVTGLLGIAIDITEKKEAERLLCQSEARFRDIALSMADFIWETDSRGVLTFCSDKVREMLGFSVAEMIGRPYGDFISSEDFCQQGQSKLPIKNLERWVADKEGFQRCLLISGVPKFDEYGEFQGYRGVTEDITKRKQDEAGLKKALAVAEDSRDKIDNIIESIADGLIVTDTGNRIVLINDKARELMGIASPLAGASIDRVIRDLPLLNQIDAVFNHTGGQPLQTSFKVELPKQDTIRFLQARTSLLRNKQSEVTGSITVLRDVTRERELERLKSEFFSVAAHELRTPLTSILGYLEFCLNPEDFGGFSAGQQHEFLEEINNKAELLAKLVSDLLDISRIESGKPLPLDIRSINMERVIGKVVEQFRLQAPRHHFSISLEEGPPGAVQADEDKVVQVLENLLSNAVKYSPEGSQIQVFGGTGADVYHVSVQDCGIGMTPEQTARIFDRFYRADFSNTAAKGLGLGMSIAQQIILRHGGDINVESEKGKGTRVAFTVPLA